MTQDTAASAGDKRSRDETDTLSPPNADLELKRPRFEDAITTLDGHSPGIRLGSIAAAISGVFGYNRPAADTNGDAVTASTNGTAPPSADAAAASPQTQPPTSVAASPAKPAPVAPMSTQTHVEPAPAPPRPPSPPPRPAIKLKYLKGTKWDTTGKTSPAKKPAAKPRGRKKAAAPASVPVPRPLATPLRSLENSGDVPRPAPAVAAEDASLAPTLADSPTKSRLFSPSVANAPKGILTPTKKRGPRPSKNVTFEGNGLGGGLFDHIPRSASAKKPGRPKKKLEQQPVDDITCGICAKPHSKPPNEIILCDNCDFAVHQECYGIPEIPEGDWLCKSCTQEDVLQTTKADTGLAVAPAPRKPDVPEIPNLDRHLSAMQRLLLDRCAGRRRIRMFGQDEASDKVKQLIEQTVLAGEGNSMLLIGPRGSGKTTLVENTISELSQEYRQDFHVVRLSGFIHTDDKIALREIWRQLGKEMQVEDDLLNRSNYADTMASLLALLSHPSEILGRDEGVTSQAVVFVIDEFDMFAAHPRQTLLYNLFDIAQSRKAPIAVLGCTTRMDVVEMLEKRVKSRFSHRYVYLSLAKALPAYWQICRQGLMLGEADGEKEGLDVGLEGYADFQEYWTRKIDELYKHRQFQDLLQYHFYTTKSASAFFSEWMLPLSYLSPNDLTLRVPAAEAELTSLAPPDSRMQLLNSLSELDLSLLIAAARLDIVAHTDTVNFAMAYDEYSALVGKQRVQSAASGLVAVGGNVRVWGRGVASTAWERLVGLSLLVPSGLGGGRTLGSGGLDGRMWKVDVSLEEIPSGVKLSAVMAKWCREI
ncbi:Zinc finger, FYVE/PHD-type [Cordyceps fumosorosea ARSEF 2679]|uniref:Origin recognition complex subunit 4 n=1 Tax=Cordyceps fumosorosea (strain ARSEF 2679) TaxID=1081104 RepID=A0A167TNK9_CORFA|nr:Zinc finger, FYVE/PHD-type [Cordyceps fumosorosea ARSEF 2679]OAA60784.1 Zinc finger, FYVE/PHD-type [Cordyceps fumosorosea ARSEF 2679]